MIYPTFHIFVLYIYTYIYIYIGEFCQGSDLLHNVIDGSITFKHLWIFIRLCVNSKKIQKKKYYWFLKFLWGHDIIALTIFP